MFDPYLIGSVAPIMQGDLAVWFPGDGSCILCVVDSPAGEGVVNLLYGDTFFEAALPEFLLIPKRSDAHHDLGKLIGKRWASGEEAWQAMKPYKTGG